MAGILESVTRVAVEEIIANHSQKTKFGRVLTEENVSDICEELYGLLETSRNLKAAGDRLLGASPATISTGKQKSRFRSH